MVVLEKKKYGMRAHNVKSPCRAGEGYISLALLHLLITSFDWRWWNTDMKPLQKTLCKFKYIIISGKMWYGLYAKKLIAINIRVSRSQGHQSNLLHTPPFCGPEPKKWASQNFWGSPQSTSILEKMNFWPKIGLF